MGRGSVFSAAKLCGTEPHTSGFWQVITRHGPGFHASLEEREHRRAQAWASRQVHGRPCSSSGRGPSKSALRITQKCGIDVQAYLTWLFEHQGTHQDQLGRTPEQLTPMAYQGQMVERAA